MEKTRQVTVAGVKRFAKGAKHATSRGRRLNKPLSTESTRTLGVERGAENRATGGNAAQSANFWVAGTADSGTANSEALVKNTAVTRPSKEERQNR
jgi:hypothetical protein